MELENLRTVYDAQGPFATIYLEGRSPAADAEQQVRLRWQSLRENLAEQGAEDTVLSSIDSVLLVEGITEIQTDGRIIVANDSGVLLDEHWDAALGAGDAAHYAELPELGAYVRETCRLVDMVLVIADQEGAAVRQLTVAPEHESEASEETYVSGDSDEGIHKPREGALSHNQIRRHADEIIKDNARQVAEFVDKLVSEHVPEAVVIAGEVQGRTAVKAEFTTAVNERLHEITQGGTEDEAAEEHLYSALRSLASDLVQARFDENTSRLSQATAHDRGVEGRESVTKAAQRGAVETLLLNYDQPATDERSALSEAVRSSAQVDIAAENLEDGLAAILRFDVSAALAD